MKKYRLLCASNPIKHMRPERQFEANDDAEAIALAGAWRGERAAELWTYRYRRIATWSAGVQCPHACQDNPPDWLDDAAPPVSASKSTE